MDSLAPSLQQAAWPCRDLPPPIPQESSHSCNHYSVTLGHESSAPLVHGDLAVRYRWRMDNKAIRLKNFRALVHEFGGIPELVRLGASSYENLWQIASGTKLPSGKPRGVGDDLARQLEEKCEKPHGWMDQDNDRAALTETGITFGLWFQKLEPLEQEKIRKAIPLVIDKAVPDEVVEERMPITKERPESPLQKGDRKPKNAA